jgi:hypothetical protein
VFNFTRDWFRSCTVDQLTGFLFLDRRIRRAFYPLNVGEDVSVGRFNRQRHRPLLSW